MLNEPAVPGRQMRVMIFESSHRGHHLAHVRRILPALTSLTPDVVAVLGRQAPGSADFAVQLAPLADTCEFDCSLPALPLEPPIGWRKRYLDFKRGRAELIRLRDAIARHRPAHVYVMSAYAMTRAAGKCRLMGTRFVPRGVAAEALILGSPLSYPGRGVRNRFRVARMIMLARMAAWDRLLLLEPIASGRVRRAGGALARRACLLPDPIEPAPAVDRLEARARLGIPTDGRYLGIIGMVEPRKGCRRLLRAWATGRFPPDCRLLLAGALSPVVRQYIERHFATLVRDGKLVCIDRYLTEAEMSDAAAAVNVIWTAFPFHCATCSTVIRAATARRPVLGNDLGWMGEIIPRFGLGWTCSPEAPVDELADTVRGCIERANDFTLTEAGERFVRYNSVENFLAGWTDLLRRRLGLGPAEGRLTWRWALNGE